MIKAASLTKRDLKKIEAFIKDNPKVLRKLKGSAKAMRELFNENPTGIAFKPETTDLRAIATIASKIKPGTNVADIDWGCVVFVGACVFVG